LRMTRSRPYHKNDNCFVEERNGHVVRAYVGYDRLDVKEVVDALNVLYDVLTPYLNHFIASRRIVSKERIGAKWKVTREKVAKTPYQRVLERDDVTEEVKNKLRLAHSKMDPRTMKADIDRLTKRVHDIQRRYGDPKKLSKSA
ncbi:transposase, partial [Candidatus Kaiserbacteria bacterium]|nr:transposase [Candidatus Kaiserbacteria bacterium]